MLAVGAVGALALAPQALVSRPACGMRSSVQMGVQDMVGISTETGNKLWDPLELSKNMDEQNLKLIRAAELKHCRVAMLAVVGWAWTATGTHFEGMLSTSKAVSFADMAAQPNPLLAASLMPPAGVWQMILAIGALEVTWENKYPSNENAGYFGVPACTTDPEKFKQLQLMELKNGRLAMIGIISFACAVAIPGSVPFYPF